MFATPSRRGEVTTRLWLPCRHAHPGPVSSSPIPWHMLSRDPLIVPPAVVVSRFTPGRRRYRRGHAATPHRCPRALPSRHRILHRHRWIGAPLPNQAGPPHSSTVVDRVLHIDQPTSQPRTPDWRRTPSIAVVAGSSPPSSSSWWRCCAHIWSSTSRPPSTPRAGFQEQIRSLEQPFTTNHPECTPSHKIFDVILGCRAKIIPRII